MNKEVLFIKYLDQQLGKAETENLEKLIRENPEAKKTFDEVKLKRQHMLDALEVLNPVGEIIVPPFEANKGRKKRFLFKTNIWRYAAAVVLLLALSLSFWLFDIGEPGEIASNQTDLTLEQETDMTIETHELDYNISPNRCWNQRQLVWTVIELND
jgi:hypothetical protein